MLQGFIETFNSNTSDTTAGINSDIDLNLALSHSSVATLSDSVVQLELDSSGVKNPTAVSGPRQSILVISSCVYQVFNEPMETLSGNGPDAPSFPGVEESEPVTPGATKKPHRRNLPLLAKVSKMYKKSCVFQQFHLCSIIY